MGIEELLPERTPVDGLDTLEKAEERGFYLYREAATLVAIAGSMYFGHPEEFPLNRNQAILTGLVMRTSKFMISIVKLAGGRADAEVIAALNRCLLESAINIEYLASKNSEAAFNEYVERSLAPERELYDEIIANIASRGGQHLAIEDRMIASINSVCRASGKGIDAINKKQGQWGGNFRARLKELDKEGLYLTIQRMGSHAIHGTWVDLYLNHLHEGDLPGKYCVRPKKSPDARLLTPVATLALHSILAYLEYVYGDAETILPLVLPMNDLLTRLTSFEEDHEKLLQQRPR